MHNMPKVTNAATNLKVPVCHPHRDLFMDVARYSLATLLRPRQVTPDLTIIHHGHVRTKRNGTHSLHGGVAAKSLLLDSFDTIPYSSLRYFVPPLFFSCQFPFVVSSVDELFFCSYLIVSNASNNSSWLGSCRFSRDMGTVTPDVGWMPCLL